MIDINDYPLLQEELQAQQVAYGEDSLIRFNTHLTNKTNLLNGMEEALRNCKEIVKNPSKYPQRNIEEMIVNALTNLNNYDPKPTRESQDEFESFIVGLMIGKVKDVFRALRPSTPTLVQTFETAFTKAAKIKDLKIGVLRKLIPVKKWESEYVKRAKQLVLPRAEFFQWQDGKIDGLKKMAIELEKSKVIESHREFVDAFTKSSTGVVVTCPVGKEVLLFSLIKEMHENGYFIVVPSKKGMPAFWKIAKEIFLAPNLEILSKDPSNLLSKAKERKPSNSETSVWKHEIQRLMNFLSRN